MRIDYLKDCPEKNILRDRWEKVATSLTVTDIVQPIYKKPIVGFPNSTFNIACRIERVDWNIGKFKETGDKIYDEVFSFMPAISWRPIPSTVIRFNYRNQKQRDLLGNPPSKTGVFQFGVSSYF